MMALLATVIPPRSSSLRPSMQSLMEKVQTFIVQNPPQPQQSSRMDQPFEPLEYTCRKAALEVCTVAICPSCPEYMIIGTYALVKKEESSETAHQVRKGTLSIMTVATPFKPAYPGMLPPFLDTKPFPCAILDIHFHPNDDTLLGVATSNATIHFFRLTKYASVIDRRIELRLIPLGEIKVAEDDQHGLVHLITQFTWLPTIESIGKEGVNDVLILTLAATESSGNVKLVKAGIPAIKTNFDKRIDILSSLPPPEISSVHLRKHDQEAWTVATFSIPAPEDQHHRILLSGGDDSALKASLINLTTPANTASTPSSKPDPLSILSTPVIDRWIDRKSHNAGVTAILPLPPLPVIISSPLQSPAIPSPSHSQRARLQTTIPVLTGSYDESIRVYTVDPVTTKQVLHAELALGGGVWRLALMDSYYHHDTDDDGDDDGDGSNGTAASPLRKFSNGSTHQHNYIVLASCMHTGVRILRITYTYTYPYPTSSSTSTTNPWTITPVVQFKTPHESMVYCCDFRPSSSFSSGIYTIVSTSFYDARICVWDWTDEVRVRMLVREQRKEKEKETAWPVRQREGNVNPETAVHAQVQVSGWVVERGEWKMR